MSSHRVVHNRNPSIPAVHVESPVISTQDVPTDINDDRGSNSTQNTVENLNIGPVLSGNNFLWGTKSGIEYSRDLDVVYQKIVSFRQNQYKLPSGSAGKEFIMEMTRLIRAWNSKS